MVGADPAMGQNSYQMWPTIGTYLLRRDPETWKLYGDGVESWSFSPDGLELTLKARQAAKWENKAPVNGRSIEARDLVYSIRSIAGLQYPDLPAARFPRKSNLEDMEDASVVDQYTAKVKMKHASSTFLDGMANYLSPMTPDGIREAFGGRDSLATPSVERYITAGPFKLTKFQDGVEALYSRNTDYWEKADDGQAKPFLDAIREIWIPDQGTALAAFIAGQLDFLQVTNPQDREFVRGNMADAQILSYAPQACWHRVAFNTSRKPFDDVRVRRALSLVLDPQETGKTLYGDFDGKRLWRLPGPLPWTYPESLSQDDLAKSQFYESPKSQRTTEEARSLLQQAGITSLEFEMILTTSTNMRDHATLVQSQIQKALPNVKVRLAPMDNAIQLEKAAKGDFESQYYCYVHEPTALAQLKTVYYSTGGRNSAQYKDPQMDSLLDQAAKELNEQKRNDLLRQVQLRALDQVPMMPVIHYANQMAFSPRLRGMRMGAGSQGEGIFAKELWLTR